jgi:hypothetical protein
MKTKLLLSLIIISLFISCLPDDNVDTTNQPETIVQWHLNNVTGGFAGVDYHFEMGVVVWQFEDANGILYVENNNTEDNLEDGFDTGIYSYRVLEDEESRLFLEVNDMDEGLLTISDEDGTFTLDQNIKYSGAGADGYVYTFTREVIVID